jgi:hypothetical protein
MAKYLRQAASSGGPDKGVHLALDAKALEVYPALWEYMSEASWGEGKPRELATLLLFLDGGRLKAMLNDRDSGRVAFVTGCSLEEVLEALEGGLVSSSLDWRASQRSAGRRTGKS